MQLREKLPEIETKGVHVALIVQGTAEEAARFCGGHGVQSACVADPEKASYRAMGLGRTSWKEILTSPDVRKRRGEAMAQGCRVSLRGTFQKHSDVMQLPGAALIARGGRVLWLHRGRHAADLPLAGELREIVARKLEAA